MKRPISEAQKRAAIVAAANLSGISAMDAIWRAAEQRDNPLHALFIWDRHLAAIEHWRDTAREIIAICEILPRATLF